MKNVLKFSALALLAAGLTGWDRPHDGGGRCRVPADAALSFVEVARFDVPNAS